MGKIKIYMLTILISLIFGSAFAAAPKTAAEHGLMQGFPPALDKRVTLENWQDPPYNRWGFQHVRELIPTARVSRGRGEVRPFERNPQHLDDISFAGADGETMTIARMLENTYTDGIIVLHKGRIVTEQYFNGMQPDTSHLWMSCTKSLTSAVFGIMVDRGLVDVAAKVSNYLPEIAGSTYADATVQQLLDMEIGVHFSEDYEDPNSDIWTTDYIAGWRSNSGAEMPESMYEFLPTLKKEGEHGEVFHYVSSNTDVLGWILERVTKTGLSELISQEIWTKLGVEQDGYITVDKGRFAIASGGFNGTLRDMARFGQMILQNGLFNGEQIVPAAWIKDVLTNGNREAFARSEYAGVFPNPSYRNQFWVAAPGHPVIQALGIHGQSIYINPEAQLVVTKFSTQPQAVDILMFQDAFLGAEALAEALSKP